MKLKALKLFVLASIASLSLTSCTRDKISPQTTISYNLDANHITVNGGWPEYNTTFAGGYAYRYFPTVYNNVWMHEIIGSEGPNTWLWIRKNTETLVAGTTYTISPNNEFDLVTVMYKGVDYASSPEGSSFSFTVTKVTGDLIDGTFVGHLKGSNGVFVDITAGVFTNVKLYSK